MLRAKSSGNSNTPIPEAQGFGPKPARGREKSWLLLANSKKFQINGS